MKPAIFLILLLFFANYLAGQTACKYNGSSSAIESELSKRNTNTGKHKLNQQELQKIAGYWVADCKCKRGVETRSEAEKLYNEAFTSRQIHAYQDGKNYKKDLSVFGDLEPPFAVFTISSCLNGNNSMGGMTIESGTNCAPESSRIKDLDGQLAAYATQFFVAYCQCKNGVPSKDYADNLVATMKSTHRSFTDFKNGATPALKTQPLNSCDIVAGEELSSLNKPLNEKNLGEILIGDELSSLTTSFANELAGISDNPKVKRLAGDLNSIQQEYGEAFSLANQFGGLDAETQQLFNFAQNVETIVAVGKAVFGKEPSIEEQLSESQLAVRKHILKTGRNLRTMYDEVVAIEPYTTGGAEYLNRLEKNEERIEEYNALTVRERYLYLWYLAFDGYPNEQDYSSELAIINQLTVNQLLVKTAGLQQNFDMSKRLHIANEDIAFAGPKNLIQLYKIRHYKEIGKDDLVAKIKSSLSFDDVPIGGTVDLLIETFNQKEYYATSRYAQIVQDHFQNEEVMQLFYEDIPGLPKQYSWESEEGIDRGEISILMLLGVIASVETEQISLAQNSLEVMERFHQNSVDWSEQESHGRKWKKFQQDAVVNVVKMHLTKSHLALNAAKAYVNIGLENYVEAVENIESAIEHLTINNAIPEPFFLRLKILAFLGLDDFDSAKEVFRKWNGFMMNVSTQVGADSYQGINFIDKKEKDFFNVFIRYQKNDYNGALIAVKLMKKKDTDQQPRVYLLEEEIYKALNKEEEAKEAHYNYINSLD